MSVSTSQSCDEDKIQILKNMYQAPAIIGTKMQMSAKVIEMIGQQRKQPQEGFL